MKSISTFCLLLFFCTSTAFSQLPTVSLSVNNSSISEIGGTATVTATLSAAKTSPVFIYLTPTGTASLGLDYSNNPSTSNARIIAGANGASSSANQLSEPYGVFVDAFKNIYIADRSNHRIQKWAPGATTGVTVAGGNGQGSNANQLNSPSGVFVDSNGDIYIADSFNQRIQKWTSGATTGVTVAGGNGSGSAANQFNNVSAVYVDSNGNIYGVDQSNNRVQKWMSGASSGITVAGGNGLGSAANQFNLPSDVFVDVNGNVFVCDSQNSRIQKWASGATTGVTVAGGNGAGSAANQLNKANGMYVDTGGNIYVADMSNHRIQKWASGASSGVPIGGGNGAGGNFNQFNNPTRITGDTDGNIYISDRSNARIQVISSQSYIPIIIAANQTIGSTVISAINDNIAEPDESVILTPNSSTADVSTTSAINVTISRNPTILLSAPNPIEEQSGSVNLIVALSNRSYNPVTVNLSFSGAALKNTDYTLSTETVTIPAGDSTAIIQITPINDNLVEQLESLIINVSSATNSSTPYPTFTTYIKSDDKPTVSLSVNNATISEVNGNATVTATLVAPISSDVVIDLIPSGSAVYNADYSATSSTTPIITVIGTSGSGANANQLSNPLGVFVDDSRNIYVADADNNRIQKWVPGAIAGITVAGGNGAGANANQLNKPSAVFVTPNGDIYIADASNHRIQKWTSGATSGLTVAGGNGAGNSGIQLNSPTGVFVDSLNNIYVADYFNHRIQKWEPGASFGSTVAGGSLGEGSSQFRYAEDIFIDSSGNMYIADQNNNRVQKWPMGSNFGTTVAGNGGYGNTADKLVYANGIYIDISGNVYVADRGNHRIQKWAPGASSATTVAGGNGAGAGSNQLNEPSKVFLDNLGAIYIADSKNNRIQRNYPLHIYIPAGQTTGTVVINGINDLAEETNETIVLTPISSGADIGGTAPVNITITSDDGPPTIKFSAPSLIKEEKGNATLRISLNGSTTNSVTVNLSIAGTAIKGTDYNLSAESVTIPAGDTVAIIQIIPVDDILAEPLESIIFGVSNATNVTTPYPSFTTYISSDDKPTASLSVNNTTISETGQTTVTATLSSAASRDVIIDLVPSGNATYNSDYSVASPTEIITVAGNNGAGANANQLSSPYGISVDSDDNIYIVDKGNNRVQKWALGATEGTTVAGGNGVGSANNQFNQPLGIFIDAFGNKYIADPGNYRIQKWAPGDSTGTTVAGGTWGTGVGQLKQPAGVFVDNNGNIFVADQESFSVTKWAPGSNLGMGISGGCGPNCGVYGTIPTDLFVDANGYAYFVDSHIGRIRRRNSVTLDEEITVAGSNSSGSAANQLSGPNGLSFDGSGNIYIADRYNHRIQKWAPGATTGITIAGGNGAGNNANQLNQPVRVFVDSKGAVYISDLLNHRIQRRHVLQILIPAGQTTGTVVINGINDIIEEANETITLSANSHTVDVSGTSPINITLTSDDSPPTITLNASVIEEENGSANLTVSLSYRTYNPVTVNLSTSGTAVKGTDYNLSTESVTIPAGDSVATVQIIPINDNLVEQLESIIFGVASATNASTPYPSFTTYISSEDKPTASLSTSPATISEVNGTATITATLASATSRDVIIDLVPSGTATYNSDYSVVSATGIITVAGGNGTGAGANQLSNPHGTHVDANGNIFIADKENNRIQKWAPLRNYGITVAGGNGPGSGANQLNQPASVSLDSDGNINIADVLNHRIQKWAPGASSGITVVAQLNQPNGVFVDGNGNKYIADVYNHRIQKWGVNSVTTVAGGNGAGSGANQLFEPTDIWVDGSGNMYIADKNNHRIQKWAPGAASGTTVAGGNGAGSQANKLNTPTGVSVDSFGNIYIADQSNNRVQKWAPGATSGTTIAGGISPGSGANQLNAPSKVFIDNKGAVYISDRLNNRIQRQYPLQIYIPAGQTIGTVTVNGINDIYSENDESITLTPTSFLADVSSTTPVNITITSEDAPPTVNLIGPSLIEEEKGSVNMKITLSYRSSNPVTINFSTSGTAIKGTDYTLSAESITIQPGDTVATFQIIPINDNLVEPLESIILAVSSATNASTPYPSFTTSLSSEDKPNLSLTSNKTFILESNGTATITASLSSPTSRDVIVSLMTSGSAEYDVDYSLEYPSKNILATITEGVAPYGIAVDVNNNFYIANGQDRVIKWARGATTGIVVAGGNGVGSNLNQLDNPQGVFVDGNGDIYVAEQGNNNRITKWVPGATSGIKVAGGSGPGNANYQLNTPASVFVDANKNIYIADQGNHRIQKWAPNAGGGTTVAGGNGPGAGPNQLYMPSDLFVDGTGNVYIADWGNHRIQKWAPGAYSGTTVAGGSGYGSGANQFNNPVSIFADPSGAIYVADKFNRRIQKWLPGAINGTTFTRPTGTGGQFVTPTRVTGDSYGNLYIASLETNRVQKVNYLPNVTIPAGQTTANFTLNAINDIVDDPSETLILTPNASNANISSPNLSIDILTGSVPEQPAAFTTSSTTVCQNQNNVIYTIPAVSGATSYTWTYSGTGATFSSTSNTVSINFSASATSGTLSVTANNTYGSSPERAINITVNTAPAQPIGFSASSSNVCQGQNNVIYTVPAVNSATSYTWNYSGTGATFSSTTNTVSVNFSASATSGTLSVTANNNCGNSPALSLAVAISSGSIPQDIVLNGPLTINGQSTNLAQKSVILTPSSGNPISINTGAVFLAAILTCPN